MKDLDIDPLNARAYIVYSYVLVALHEWPTAEETVAFAIELEPESHLRKPIQVTLGYYDNGDKGAAQEFRAPAIQALPNHPAVISLLLNLALQRNEWDRALGVVDRW